MVAVGSGLEVDAAHATVRVLAVVDPKLVQQHLLSIRWQHGPQGRINVGGLVVDLVLLTMRAQLHVGDQVAALSVWPVGHFLKAII